MPHFIVTVLTPRMVSYDSSVQREVGPCVYSPTCTDATGLNHSLVLKARSAEAIYEYATKNNMYVLRVEEIFFVRDIEAEEHRVSAGPSGDAGSDGTSASDGDGPDERTTFVPDLEAIPEVRD